MRMSGAMRTAIMPLATANAGVEALSDNIRQPVVDKDLDFDVRIVAQEPRKLGQQDRIRRVFGGRDPDGAGRLLARFAHGGESGADLLDPRATVPTRRSPASVSETLRVVRALP